MSTGIASPALEQAADWFAQRQQGGWSGDDQQRWECWLHADTAHAQAWQQVELIWQSFAPLSSQAAAQALQAAGQRRRRALQGLGGALAIGTVTLLGMRGLDARMHLRTVRTAAARSGHWTLADGSRLWLNADSEATVDITAEHRNLHLLRGELLLQTGHAPAFAHLPLRVHTLGARLQPLGTRFAVSRDATGSRLDVFEDAVRCTPWLGAVRDVVAGEALQISPSGTLTQIACDPLRGDWNDGRLQAARLPLAQVVRELARYHPGYLGCDPRVAQMAVTAVLPRQDSAQALSLLARALPIRIEQRWPWWTVVRPA